MQVLGMNYSLHRCHPPCRLPPAKNMISMLIQIILAMKTLVTSVVVRCWIRYHLHCQLHIHPTFRSSLLPLLNKMWCLVPTASNGTRVSANILCTAKHPCTAKPEPHVSTVFLVDWFIV